jgi:hypothetical protein
VEELVRCSGHPVAFLRTSEHISGHPSLSVFWPFTIQKFLICGASNDVLRCVEAVREASENACVDFGKGSTDGALGWHKLLLMPAWTFRALQWTHAASQNSGWSGHHAGGGLKGAFPFSPDGSKPLRSDDILNVVISGAHLPRVAAGHKLKWEGSLRI